MGQYQPTPDLPLLHAGKVRELYDWDADRLLMVATDRVSTFDIVLDDPIPGKGEILTQMSLWWFDQLADLVDNHVLPGDIPAPVTGRAMICERLDMMDVECIARGYLTGSGWAEYQDHGTVWGIALPPGLHNGSKLDEPIFTPTTKAPLGQHDEPLTFTALADHVGEPTASTLRDLTLGIYGRAERIAAERGIILADTKLEFGRRDDGTIVLADEALTPDSSRFIDAATWRPGARMDSYDKQFLRDWLTHESGWDPGSGQSPPVLPPQIIAATRQRYLQAYYTLTQDSGRVRTSG
jgi:phosphoribosylaminoimidazole-succinocarboxamide synthase